MTMKRRLRALGAVVLLAALGFGGVQVARRLPLTVDVVRPETDVAIRVFGLGTVEARIASRIGFEASGTLAEALVDANDRVTAGQAMARLDSAEQKARVAKAEANLEHARADVRKSAASVDKARAVLVKRQEINQRRQALLKASAASVEAATDARTDAEVAAADVTVALAEADVAQAVVRDALAALLMETVLLSRRTLVAPYDAVVLARHKELGAVLAPGEAAFTVADSGTIWIQVFVDERSSGGLAVGQMAEIRLRSAPGQTFSGQLARIDIESDRVSEERRLYIACRDCPSVLHPGEQAEALITVARLPEAVLIPRVAISNLVEGTGLAWVIEDGHLARQRLTFGRATHDGRLEVTGGLSAGTLLVAKPIDGLREGRAVKASPPKAPDP